MSTKTLFFVLMLVSLVLAVATALFPAVDLAVSGYFLQPNPPIKPTEWWWVVQVNEYTPDVFRSLVILCALAWIVSSLVPRWRHAALAFAFVGLSIGLGPGYATYLVKDHHLRARPFDVQQFGGTREFSPALARVNQCEDNCAFVSGHAACGMALAGLMLLYPRRRYWWLGAGLVAGLGIGFARIGVGAHWLSDVLWAYPLTLLSAWLVWQGLSLFYKEAKHRHA